MPYSVGERGSYGCSGYPVIKDDDKTVMGCHDSAEAAGRQIAAIEANETKEVGIRDPDPWPGTRIKTEGTMGQPRPASTKPSVFRKPKKRPRRRIGGVGGSSAGAVATTGGGTGMGTKSEHDWLNPKPIPETGRFQDEVETRDSMAREIGKDGHIKEGDFVMGETTEGLVHGVVEHIMWEGGVYGQPGTEYAIESAPENPAMAIRVYEEDMNEDWVPTAYSIGMRYSDAVVVDMEDHDMDEDDMEYMSKADTYSPNDGMKAAARTAIKWKEDGKAKGAGTAVGWGRARDIVAGRSMSLSVVKRMYSFFSRHEVDKQGKGFNPGSEGYPSKGRVMWNAWGGDAGFAWSRAIVKRNEDKALFADFGKDFTRATKLTEVFKADSVRVGQMVSWNSSGGRATGKVKRIISSGSYNVPGTEFTINGTEENPAVVITLYRNGKPTDQTVAHRRSSLRAL
jgi:hypothetical protein